MNNLFVFLLVVFAILQILDVVSTRKAIKSGNGEEANPIARFFMKKLGFYGAVLVIKLAIGVAVYFWVSDPAFDASADLLFMVMANVFYAVIVVNNFKIAKG